MKIRFLHIDLVKVLDGLRLEVSFNNGRKGIVDLKDELTGPIFEPLQDSEFFHMAMLNAETGTVEWPNGADFAPEFLYQLAFNENYDAHLTDSKTT